MPGFPRIVLISINIAILIVGVYHIVYAHDVWEASSINTCLRVNETLIRWIAGISSAIAVVGIIGVYLKLEALECFYLFALLFSTAATIILCLFVWAMLPGDRAEVVFYLSAEHGIWLERYGSLIQNTLANRKDWSAAKACFRDIDTCWIMSNQTEDQKVVYIDLGCCTPPNRCGLEQASTGSWVKPKHGLNATDSECEMWARVGKNCYECDSCKAGYLGNYHKQWDSSLSLRVQCIAFLIVTSALAYYMFMHDHYSRDRDFDVFQE